jgi:hypothetical protein
VVGIRAHAPFLAIEATWLEYNSKLPGFIRQWIVAFHICQFLSQSCYVWTSCFYAFKSLAFKLLFFTVDLFVNLSCLTFKNLTSSIWPFWPSNSLSFGFFLVNTFTFYLFILTWSFLFNKPLTKLLWNLKNFVYIHLL